MTDTITILLHSSKTMRTPGPHGTTLHTPQLIEKAKQIGSYLKTLPPAGIAHTMHVSPALAEKTHTTISRWNTQPQNQSLAIDSFVGDIYSGLRASELSTADRDYADQTLCILSGLYGMIHPYDGIMPYRLEMGYKFDNPQFNSLYTFWGDTITACLPSTGIIVNVSSVEYTKAVLPYIDPARVITPRFLTIDPKTNEPAFVVVHAKIARGAFARWLITSRTTDPIKFSEFSDLNYIYAKHLSTPSEPVFICQTFGGIGLSMRLN